MARKDKTEVLVVGAGPVGLLAALTLAEQGIEVEVLDEARRVAGHSYACGLHPGTLALLDRLGISKDILERGRRINTVAFYEGGLRRGEIKLLELESAFPYVLVLPQSGLEQVLEATLEAKGGIHVRWNHRVSHLTPEESMVSVTTEKLGGTSRGYIVPHWESVVKGTRQIDADFVIGADGHNSLIRRSLAIDYEQSAEREMFVVYEFKTDAQFDDEVRVVFHKDTTNVVWPLPEGRCRWSFQWLPLDEGGDFPEKDRQDLWFEAGTTAEQSLRNLKKLLEERAPWFTGSVDELDWAIDVQFEHRLAREFGSHRCCLAGDAAHQTSPAGMQSMNAGIQEAAALAQAIKSVLRDGGGPELLENYGRTRKWEWERLVGLGDKPRAAAKTPAWVKKHRAQILSCIPSTGEDFVQLAGQLALDLDSAGVNAS
jgi:2-polyprenyl-6-methoxyphenol hydroxylase-like FAD-dependent oxidoreductase